MTFESVALYAAPVVPVALSLLDRYQTWRKEESKKKAVVTALLLAIGLLAAWLLTYGGIKSHRAQVAQFREEAARQAERAEGLRLQNQVLHGDVQARVRAVEEISGLIAKGCISDPQLRKQAEAVHTKLTRGGPNEIGAQLQWGTGATAVSNEKNH